MKDRLLAFVHVFAMMAPWLVFGFLMAGIIAVWIPRNWVNRVMGGSSGFGGILRAVAIGVAIASPPRFTDVSTISLLYQIAVFP